MQVKMLQEAELKVSEISTKKWPAGWQGDVADELAVQMILLGLAEDAKGEVTREGLEAEIARLQAAENGEPAPVTAEAASEAPKARSRKKKAAVAADDSAPQA